MVKVLTDYERGWLEAAIDGEGSIIVTKSSWRAKNRGEVYPINVNVMLWNTNKEFLEKARDICGKGEVRVWRAEHKNPKWKSQYWYRIPNSVLRDILPQLKLVIKEEQRIIAIEVLRRVNRTRTDSERPKWNGYCHKYTEDDVYFFQYAVERVKELNKRGKEVMVVDESIHL